MYKRCCGVSVVGDFEMCYFEDMKELSMYLELRVYWLDYWKISVLKIYCIRF